MNHKPVFELYLYVVAEVPTEASRGAGAQLTQTVVHLEQTGHHVLHHVEHDVVREVEEH